jgi:outer membrane protein TolC
MVTLALVAMMSAGAPLFAEQISFTTAARQQQTTPPPTAPQTQQTPQAPAGPTLELSMDQAVTMALENNLDLKSQRFGFAITSQGVAAARAAYLPQLTASLSRTASTSDPLNIFETTQAKTVTTFVNGGTRYGQNLPWLGSSYSVSWGGTRNVTNAISNFNPRLTSSLSVRFDQPLWQRFAIDNNRFNLQNSQRNVQIADLQLQSQILAVQDTVRLAYLNLTSSIAGLEVAREIKRFNDVALSNARARIAVGNAAEIDGIQSEAAVLSSEEAIINAEAAIAQAEDQLRALLLDPSRPDYWQIRITPTDQMEVRERTIDVDAAIKNALANRLDLTQSKQQLEQTQLRKKLAQDATKPSVDLFATYSASGTAGILLDPDTGVPAATLGFGGAFGDSFGNTNPSWTFGLNVGYPIGQSGARVQAAQTQIQIDQQQLNLRIQELQIVTQVRDAARQVEAGFRRVQSTQRALAASQQQLRAEERKQEVGMSSQFDVILKQQLLATAKTAELNARIQYNRALITFDRVQRIR